MMQAGTAFAKSTTHAAITNGSATVPGADGRSAWARRMRDLTEAYSHDLGGDLTEAQRSMVRRAATLTITLEGMESAFAKGGTTAKDADIYARIAGNLRRLQDSMGLTVPNEPSRARTAPDQTRSRRTSQKELSL